MDTYQKKMEKHFSEIAPSYRDVRITDLQPIQFISKRLKELGIIRAADIGCGTGRYDMLLFKHLDNLHLTCIDSNEAMLKQTSAYLEGNGITNFFTVKANANNLPFLDSLMDCVFTFNAVHHFDFHRFLEETARILRKDGLTFIYTRLQSQNERNIWGKHFPLFLDKEARLYELNDITEAVDSISCSTIECIKNFRFKRKATLNEVTDKAKTKHYSTFSFYDNQEFADSLNEFVEKIIHHFADPERIEWFDENILIVLRLGGP